ncbi:lipid II flippase MurJ [Marinobacterium jannaschii]|uniref:lipid II flippase MurJ n=1 Tax=Marinobacterium jannaschii TaxID=64970 RepID=UPI000B0A25A8|nr:lipid II flippase MurJ [Marinobacterium jannaschii]
MIKKILLASVVLNVGMLLGRLSGFFREAVLAGTYGVSPEADVVVLLLSVPDLLINILVGGGLTAALIPEFSGDKKHAKIVWFQSVVVFTLLFSVVALILGTMVLPLLGVLAPGFTEHQLNVSQQALVPVFWLMPLTVAAGVMTAFLQAHSHFTTPALGTLIVNICIVAGLVCVSSFNLDLVTLGFFVLLGGIVRLVSQFAVACWLKGLPDMTLMPWLLNRDLIVRYLQVAGAGSLLLIYPVVSRAFASQLDEGGIALLSYATKLVELPLALAVTFLSVVFFPRLSSAHACEKAESFNSLTAWGMRLTVFLAAMSVVALLFANKEVVSLVYGHGKVSSQVESNLSTLFTIGLASIPFMGIATFATAVFSARKHTRIPLYINCVSLILLGCLLSTIGADSLTDIMWSLVAAYVFGGVLFLLALVKNNPEVRRSLLSGGSISGCLLPPAVLYFILSVVLPQDASPLYTFLLISIVSLAVTAVSALCLPQVRSRLYRRERSYD